MRYELTTQIYISSADYESAVTADGSMAFLLTKVYGINEVMVSFSDNLYVGIVDDIS